MSTETILAARAAAGYRLALVPHPGGGFEARRLVQGQLVGLEGPRPAGYPTLLEAAEVADARIQALLDGRLEAEAVEVVDTYLAGGRLRERMVDVEGVPTRHWEARDAGGQWTAPAPTPRAAVRIARLEAGGGFR